MAAYRGGELVRAGFFFNLDSWEITTVSGREGGILDGTPDARYRRLPVLAALALAPFLGALFAVFLPFIGIALVAQYLGAQAWHGVRHLSHALVVALGPAWQPSAAHLTGTPDHEPDAEPDAGARAAGQALDALEREIVDRDQREKSDRL